MQGRLTDGSAFDSSYDLDVPLEFKLGAGQVIQGWEMGVLGACIGDKRNVKISPDMGNGQVGACTTKRPGHLSLASFREIDPVLRSGGATLLFDIEIVEIKKPSWHLREDAIL